MLYLLIHRTHVCTHTHEHTHRLQRLEGQLAIAKNRQAAAEDSLNVTMREQALEAEVSPVWCDRLDTIQYLISFPSLFCPAIAMNNIIYYAGCTSPIIGIIGVLCLSSCSLWNRFSCLPILYYIGITNCLLLTLLYLLRLSCISPSYPYYRSAIRFNSPPTPHQLYLFRIPLFNALFHHFYHAHALTHLFSRRTPRARLGDISNTWKTVRLERRTLLRILDPYIPNYRCERILSVEYTVYCIRVRPYSEM